MFYIIHTLAPKLMLLKLDDSYVNYEICFTSGTKRSQLVNKLSLVTSRLHRVESDRYFLTFKNILMMQRKNVDNSTA